ncbi:cellulose biosynthesis protein BcsR [Bordetella sp. 2513F-2]
MSAYGTPAIEPGAPTPEDDIASLKAHLGLQAFPYVDIAAQRELEDAYARWPLLRELRPVERSHE